MGFLSNLLLPRPSADIIEDGEQYWYDHSNLWSVSSQAGERVTSASLMTSATCFACTKALAETFAGLPGAVYRKFSDRKEEDESQDAWSLLVDQPNPEMDAYTFWEIAVSRVLNTGNFYAEIQRDNRDRPVALWPIHPSRVQPMRDSRDGSLFWEISRDYTGDAEMQDPTWRAENLRMLSNHNMFNIVGFGSTNGIISRGILPGAEEVGIDFATRRYGADFFSKGATPAGVVEHPDFIKDRAKRAQFRTDLNQIHSNKMHAHRIGVLWHNAKYKQISVPPEAAQFLETRKYTSLQLCKIYGVPPAIIGDYEHSKFATADAMIRAFVMVTLKNLVVRMEKAINRQILNVRDRDGRLKKAFTKELVYELALDGLLRGDPKTQAETWKMMREAGAASANEWRAEIGMNPISGKEGDYLIVPGGFARLDKIDQQGTRPQNDQSQDQKTEQKDAADAFWEKGRERLIELFEEAGYRTNKPAQVQGHDPLREAALDIAVGAVERIHSITTSQINRWREQDPKIVQEKLSEFWQKQYTRLSEACLPADKVLGKVREGAAVSMTVPDAYLAKMTPLDAYEIFDESKTQPPTRDEIAQLIEDELCD